MRSRKTQATRARIVPNIELGNISDHSYNANDQNIIEALALLSKPRMSKKILHSFIQRHIDNALKYQVQRGSR